MTRCELIGTLLAGYVSGEATPFERSLVADHLAECAGCRAELARERRLRSAAASLPAVTCPDAVSDRILAAVDAEASRRAPRRPWRRPAALAALGAAAAVALILLTPVATDRSTAPAADAWTRDDLDRGREDVERVLALTADIIDRTERRSLGDVMRLLRTHAGPAQDGAAPTNTGGRG